MTEGFLFEVLNLVINGWPSIHMDTFRIEYLMIVLNLVINGWPSILNLKIVLGGTQYESFKPCYKWMTFNTK